MAVTFRLSRVGILLSPAEEHRVRRHLSGLGRRLGHRPDPVVTLTVTGQARRQEVTAALRVNLGPLGPTLNSSQVAKTPDHATRLAVEAIERQLERREASQRREETYGVPSRRRTM